VFQFLVGRLETRIGDIVFFKRYGFQFLVGRLETPKERYELIIKYLFQFLVGRLETVDGIFTPITITQGFNSL